MILSQTFQFRCLLFDLYIWSLFGRLIKDIFNDPKSKSKFKQNEFLWYNY